MKRAVLFTCASLTVAAAGACASSEDREPGSSPGPDAEALPGSDASPNEERADAGTDAATCSAAGWCPTPLPDADLTLKDIWAFPGRAFAIAESPTLGAKVLEWTEAEGKWFYIDDNAQNKAGRGQYVGKIWAPSEDEIYFTVAPRTVFHGSRAVGGNGSGFGSNWSWEHWQLEDRIPIYDSPMVEALSEFFPEHYRGRPWDSAANAELTSLGVYGTSPDDVYAWYGNAISRLTIGAAGDRAWVVEYVADDLDYEDEQLFFLGATATNGGDIWFVGGRGSYPGDNRTCAIAVRRTGGTYRRVVDGVGAWYPTWCDEREGTALVGGAVGWLTDVHATSPNGVIGLKGGQTIAGISVVADDAYSVETSAIPSMSFMHPRFLSMWAAADGPIWLGGTNIVVRGDDVWNDGGAYEISTLSLNGAWLGTPIYQVRASSKGDVWAVGAGYALHKTTP